MENQYHFFTLMHFLTGSAKYDFDSEVASDGVFEKPASDWSEAFAMVVSDVVILKKRITEELFKFELEKQACP